MADSVIIFVADVTHLPHAKSLMVNCVHQGGWKGDFCLIASGGWDTQQIEKRGIPVLPTVDAGFLAKFSIFSPFFRRWRRALYMDCDILVQGPLERLFACLPAADGDGPPILCDLEDGPVIGSWLAADHEKRQKHPELYAEMVSRYPHVLERMWNTAFVLFRPAEIPDGTVTGLRSLQEHFKESNHPDRGGTDQQIINLHLYAQIGPIPNKTVCFWGLDEPQNRVASEFRGWSGDEVPVALHYCRWYAPWIEKTSDADAYRQPRLDRVCRELYAENLRRFKEVFRHV